MTQLFIVRLTEAQIGQLAFDCYDVSFSLNFDLLFYYFFLKMSKSKVKSTMNAYF